jgi:hypothetical protein
MLGNYKYLSAEIKSPAFQEKSAEIKQESSKAGDFQRMGICRKILMSGFSCENILRPLCLGKKNYMFFGSECGGKTASILYTLIGSCRANRVNPYEYLKDILARINSHPNSQLETLLPHNWRPSAR